MTVKIHGTLNAEFLSRPEIRPLLGKEVDAVFEESTRSAGRHQVSAVREVDPRTDPGWKLVLEGLSGLEFGPGHTEELRESELGELRELDGL